MNNKYQPVSVGTIELFNRIGYCDIQVWSDEGQIPHFHIISKNNIKWECCIELFNAKYFSHGNKQGSLTNKQLKILDKWLREKSNIIVFSDKTNWEVMVGYWYGQGNPVTNVPKNPKQPDYTKTV